MSRPVSPLRFHGGGHRNAASSSSIIRADLECIPYEAPLQLPTLTPAASAVSASATETCTICLEDLTSNPPAVQTKACRHAFHEACIFSSLQHDSKCPVCRQALIGEPVGQCPSGTMSLKPHASACPGFSCSSIEIFYVIPSGTQKAFHESPGQPYHGATRTAYLPDNVAGRQLAGRLKYAWRHGLMFHVGTSLTSGRANSVVWSSIHHKTSLQGGAHGFPDPNYLANCHAALDDLNVPPVGALGINECAPRRRTTATESLPYAAPATLCARAASLAAMEPHYPPPCTTASNPHHPTNKFPGRLTVRRRPPAVNPHHDPSIHPTNYLGLTPMPPPPPLGRCPSGTMTIETLRGTACPGHPGSSTLQIVYTIPAGQQRGYHPAPGAGHAGTTRVAFAPDTDAGLALLHRLRCAWTRGHTFAVGTSVDTGMADAVVWATIPHKTSLTPGQPYSFPDAAYLDECHARLDALHIPSAEAMLD